MLNWLRRYNLGVNHFWCGWKFCHKWEALHSATCTICIPLAVVLAFEWCQLSDACVSHACRLHVLEWNEPGFDGKSSSSDSKAGIKLSQPSLYPFNHLKLTLEIVQPPGSSEVFPNHHGMVLGLHKTHFHLLCTWTRGSKMLLTYLVLEGLNEFFHTICLSIRMIEKENNLTALVSVGWQADKWLK